MPLQVLPPGITSLTARRPPTFRAPSIALPASDSTDAFASTLASAVLARDPRSVIAEADIEPLRVWARAILGNSWSPNLSIDDVMKLNPRILYKAVCLYLQADYWGSLPDDLLGVSSPDSPAYEWPNAASKLEQRIYTWDLRMVPKAAPNYLADDVSGAMFFPIIVPSLLIQKNDGQTWKVLNKGGTDRNFTLLSPGGEWKMRGWDFGEWYATNADFAMMLKIIGFAVVATAACVTGGVALSAGAGIMAALGAGFEAAQVGFQIDGAVNGFIGACIRNDFGGAFNGLLNVVNVAFGVDLKSVAVYQPGIDQLQQVGQQIAPYLTPLINLGQATGSEVLKTINLIGRSATDFAEHTKALLIQLGVDTSRTATGMFPDQLMKNVLSMGVGELGVVADRIRADYQARANAAIRAVDAQVPLYLGDWKEQARFLVKKLGHDGATAKAEFVPWFGRSAFDAGTMIGALEANLAQSTTLDINQLTPSQKRSLFLGDISAALEPQNLLNAAEFMRQSDLVWAEWQKLGKLYFP
jgi:hypothetical protein